MYNEVYYVPKKTEFNYNLYVQNYRVFPTHDYILYIYYYYYIIKVFNFLKLII